METIEIRDVGPVHSHTIPVAPGVTILTGANEVGKSTCIAATSALAGRDIDLSVRDGCKRGLVEGLGTVLSIGKRAVRTGDLEAESVEDRLDLGLLVDPGLKDPKAATKKRVKALLSLTGTKLEVEDFASILPEELRATELSAADKDEDPVDLASKIKRRMEKRARELEERVGILAGKIDARKERLKGADLEAPSDSDRLQSALLKAVENLAKANQQLEAWENHQKAQKDAAIELAKLQSEGSGKLRAARKAHGDAEAKATEALALAGEAADEVDKLRRQLEEAERKAERLKSQSNEAHSALGAALAAKQAAEDAMGQAERLRQLAEAQAPPAPSVAEVQALTNARIAATQAVEKGAQVRELQTVAAELEALKKEHRDAERLAQVFRDAAAGTDEVLSNAVDCRTLRVIEGELYYAEGKRKEPFARLSDGKRWQVAITAVALAIQKARGDKLAILPVQQPAWEGLDDANRAIVHETAEACGVCIITAEKSTGPLASRQFKS